MSRLLRLCAFPALALLLAAGCSSGASGAGVASLSGDAAAASGEEAPTELTEEAALEFAQCMRDNGVEDFPDPTVDADGNVSFGFGPGGGGGGGVPGGGGGEMAAARETCAELVEGFAFGGGPGRGLANNTELQDALVEYTDCLREEGLDVGDFQFGGGAGGPGGGGPGAGGPGGGGGGPGAGGPGGGGGPGAGGGQQGQGGAPDPSRFIANALGLDADDPEVSAALEVCQPLLENAFSNFGPGADNN